MPDVSHGRKVFRYSQARVLIALGIHSLGGIYYLDLLSRSIFVRLIPRYTLSCSIRMSLALSPFKFRPYGRPRLSIA